MDSGRPDACRTLETGARCVGGLGSILKHTQNQLCGLVKLLTWFGGGEESEAVPHKTHRPHYPPSHSNKSVIHPFIQNIHQAAPTRSPVAATAYLNVSGDPPRSQFPTRPVDSHWAGNAAESSTELTEAEWKWNWKCGVMEKVPSFHSNKQLDPWAEAINSCFQHRKHSSERNRL